MINYETEEIIGKIDKNFIEVLTRIYDVSLEGKSICEKVLDLLGNDETTFRMKEDLNCFNRIIEAFKKHNSFKDLESKKDLSYWPILQIKKTG